MKKYIVFLVTLSLLVVTGCSSERKETPVSLTAPPEQIKALSQADRDKIAAFEKELFSIDSLTQKALRIVGNELKLVLKGEKDAVDVKSLVDGAKGEARKSLDNLVTKAVPADLPPWFNRNLAVAKKGFSDAYKAKIESMDAIRRFVDEKSPAALLEYKQKGSLADRQFQEARERLTAVLKASGLPLKDVGTAGGNSGK